MSERPIIFSGPMVKALLDGRKTQTRRILKPQPAQWQAMVIDITPPFFNEDEGGWGQVETIWSGPLVPGMCEPEREEWRPLRLPYAVGDRLWVREAWRTEARFDPLPPRDVPEGAIVSHEADYNSEPNDGCRGRYRHSRFMPRWASRITLEVTEVRVQRLQEISEEDAKAEGAEEVGYIDECDVGCRSYIEGFARLWTKLHGPGAWVANPWVAAISFKRVEP